jgi:hypothetical protein
MFALGRVQSQVCRTQVRDAGSNDHAKLKVSRLHNHLRAGVTFAPSALFLFVSFRKIKDESDLLSTGELLPYGT